MNLLAPGALALLGLALPILLLYMLRLRRRDALVSSSMLWQQLLRDRQSNTPWQRIRRQLLLFLQLLILAALVLALARPSLPVPSLASGPAVIVLDGSASMNATDVPPSRFEAARQAAQGVIDTLPDGSPVSLILAGTQPRLLASNDSDRAALRRALAQARPDLGSADWPAAFSLAAAAVSAAGAAASEQRPPIVLISDGGIQAEQLPVLPGEVRYLMIGASAENLGISALAVRPAGAKAQLFASLHNYGDQPRSAILSFYLGQELFDARQVQVAANADLNVVLDALPENGQLGPDRITARLSHPDGSSALDAFPEDDSAYTVFSPASGGRVLLVTKGNLFLRRLLENLPGIKAAVALAGADGQVEIPKQGYDVYVLDGILPPNLPPGHLLLLNPPENPLFTVGEPFAVTGAVRVARHDLTRFVLWDNIHVRAARQVTLPDWATALVQAEGGPLVFAGEASLGSQRRRVAVITFDLHDSDLPLQVTFPVLVSNLLEYLSPSSSLAAGGLDGPQSAGLANASGLAVRVGESVLVRPASDAAQVQVSDPHGQVYRLKPEEGRAVFNQTELPGIYTVSSGPTSADLAQLPEYFAANLFSPLESDIRPRADLKIGEAGVQPTARAAIGQRELWPWAAALGLALLLVEWLVYQRQRQVGALLPPGLRNWLRALPRGLLPARRARRGG